MTGLRNTSGIAPRGEEILTSFVGRESEISEVSELIRRRRLVTLTGIGGCGKTRLAARVVAQVAELWPDSVYAVDLGATTGPAQVASVVASSIGVPLEPGGDQAARLAAQLRKRRFLLWLDTCEPVVSSVAELVEAVLAACSAASVLATSREPLAITGETIWRVPPMRSDEAARLFEDRALLVAPDFDASVAADQVAEVCARVDHIPLAVELAAAWVRAFSPAQIVQGLEDSFRLLVGGPRDAAPRHQTLQASMAWSYELLEEGERRLFRRCSVFPGPFTLPGAAAVSGDETQDGQTDILRPLTRLLDASLLGVREIHGELRYQMLDTVRQYGSAMLEAAGEAEATRDRHLAQVIRVAAAAEAGMDTDQERWRIQLDSHRSDVPAALSWGLRHADARGDMARELAAAMGRQWLITGQTADGLEALTRAIELHPDDRSPTQARLHASRAMLAMAAGRMDLLDDSAARGHEIADEVDDGVARARCLAFATFPVFFVDFARCQAMARAAQEAAVRAEDPFARDWATVMEGYSLVARMRNREAESSARRAFTRSSQRRDRFCAAFARGIESYAAMTGGDLRRSIELGREAMQTVAPLSDQFGSGTITCNTAHALALSGDIQEAVRLIEPIIDSLDPRRFDVVGYMVAYGLSNLWLGDFEKARRWLEKGAARLDEKDVDWTAARALPGLVAALRQLKRTDEALRWAEDGQRMLAQFGGAFEHADIVDEHARLLREDPSRARDLHLEALVIRRDHGVRLGFPDSLDALAGLASAAGDHREAVRLCAASEAARTAMGYPRRPIDVAAHEEMVEALRAAAGKATFDEAWSSGEAADIDTLVSSLTRGRGRRAEAPGQLGMLTRAEHEVALLVGEGLTNAQISERLYMSRSTVKTHVGHIFTKLGVPNRTALAALVHRERDERIGEARPPLASAPGSPRPFG